MRHASTTQTESLSNELSPVLFIRKFGSTILRASVFVLIIASTVIACRKTDSSADNIKGQLSRLDKRTAWELNSAKDATEKYKTFENAISDGYADINVIMENMGYHYMKAANLDSTFDFRKPEILVYNKDLDGVFQLVAVEYAVPIELTPDAAPTGFTGDEDVWKRDTGFGLWLLHAWVWNYNPDGIFKPMNPRVHLR